MSAGQAVLVTGSSRGIGFATAIQLANAGFNVALNGPIDDDELQRAEREIRTLAPACQVVRLAFDVSDISNHDRMLENAESAIGPLTTLVNNAGVSVLSRGDLLDVSPESYDRCMAVNAKAMFFLSQAFAKRLISRTRAKEHFCSIVNVTSANAEAAAIQRAEYCASKAAAAMTSQCLAARLGQENIAVYDVRPGLIATDMTLPVQDHYRKRAEEGLTLMPRLGTPEEIGQIVAMLATGGLPYTTGQVISADAGLLVKRF